MPKTPIQTIAQALELLARAIGEVNEIDEKTIMDTFRTHITLDVKQCRRYLDVAVSSQALNKTETRGVYKIDWNRLRSY